MSSDRTAIMRIAVLAAALGISACTVGPDFQRPAPPSAVGYLSPADITAPDADAPRVAPVAAKVRWWEAFGSPRLDALVDQAIANSPTLAAGNATLARAREAIAAAAGRRLPQLDLNGRIEREQANLSAFGFDTSQFPGLGNPTFNLYTVGGGVSYDLDLFGGNRRRVEQAAAEAEAQQHQAEAAHLTLAGRVVNQVLTIAAIRARIATTDILLAGDQRLVDLTEARRKGGEGTLTEVLNVRSQLEADRGDVPQLGQQLDEARHMLAILLGVAPDALGPTDIELTEFRLPADVPVAVPSALVRKRPDILQAEADLHAATAAIGVATANLYPDISLGGTAATAANAAGNLFAGNFRAFDLFAGVSAPIFHGGTLKAQQRAAIDQAEASAARYRQTVLEAFGQVANLLAAIQNDRRSVRNQQSAADIAQRSRDLSQRSFKVGNSGILTVLDSQRLYQRSELALVDARARQYLNVARLYVATAGGWTGPAVETAAK